jgi:two-component system, cell cycle response regulator
VGDDVLKEVFTRLLGAVRSHDAVGRYGGEEFPIVLGGCNSEHLKDRGEQVRIAVNGSPFFTKHGSISVSVSVGATTVRGWNRSPHFETLLKRADKALYQAKAAGLNQVNFAETPVKA